MATYKQLLSEKHFLKVQLRARMLMRDGSDLVGIHYNTKELVFRTRSGTNRNKIWTQRIQITQADLQKVLEAKNFKEIEDLIKNSSLKVACDCPAFLFWGFKYIAWKKGYGIERELRRPRIRNPHGKGYVCKHLYLILQLFPFLSKTLASKFKNYANKLEEEASKKNIHNARMNKQNREFVGKDKETEEIDELEQELEK